MEDRVKERLTGAAILVTLVVLLVPELFRGERSDAVVAHGAPDGAPPLRSYTIELGTVPQGAAAAATLETPAAAPAVVADAAPPTVSQATAPAVAIAPVSGPVSPPPPPPLSHPAETARSGWVVQLGSFARRENASRLVKQAAGKGVRLVIAGPDGRGLFRVHSVPQPERRAAVALQVKLKAQGYAGVISASQ